MKTAMILLLSVPNLFALDITTLDGKAYPDCRVSRVFPDSICLLWSGGGARVKFTNLPETLRGQYGYDEQKAAAFERSEADRQSKERALLEAQRQLNQTQAKSRAPEQSPPVPAQTQVPGGNTGQQIADVNLAPSGNAGYNQGNRFGGLNGRGGAQYVGVNIAGPGGGIYGIAYGPATRSEPRGYFINPGSR